MSYEVDNRVVRMQFDNEDFEKRVKQSRKSLDDLKQATNFETSANGIKNLQNEINKFDISGISNGVDTLEKRFSLFGTFVGRTIENIADSAYNMISKTITAIPKQIVQGGWGRTKNIAFAEFSLKGQGRKDAEDIIKNQVDLAVSGTSFGLDEAARVAAQLVASGVEVGNGLEEFGKTKERIEKGLNIDGKKITDYSEDLDDLSKSLLAISGTAAMAGVSYAEIGDIFAQVRSQGKLMATQLNRFSARGLNIKSELAKYYDVDEADIADMIKKGKVGFEDLVEATFGAFADQAKASNDTIDGAFANLKSALSRIGQDYTTPVHNELIGIYNDLRKFFNLIRIETKKFGDNGWTDFISRFAHQIRLIIDAFRYLEDEDKSIGTVSAMMSVVGNLAKVLGSIFLPILRGVNDALGEFFVKFSGPNLMKAFEKIAAAVAKLELTANTQKKLQKATENTVRAIVSVLKILFNVIKGFWAYAEPIVKNLGKLLKSSIDLASKAISKLVSLFGSKHKSASKFFKSLVDGTASLKKNTKYVKAVNKAFDSFYKITEKVGKSLKKLTPHLKTVGKTIAEHAPTLKDIVNFFKNAAMVIVGLAVIIYTKLKPAFDLMAKFFGAIWEGAKGWFQSLSEFGTKIKEVAGNSDSLTETLGKIKDIKIKAPELPKLGKIIDDIKKKFKKFTTDTKKKVKDFGKTLQTWFIDKFNKIKEMDIGDHLLTIAAGIFAAYMVISSLTNTGVFGGFIGFLQSLLGISRGSRGMTRFMSALAYGVFRISNAFTRQLNLMAIHTFAIGLIELVIAIAILCRLPSDRVIESALVLVALAFLLYKSLNVMSKTSSALSGFKNANITGTLVGMAIALLAIAESIKIFTEIDFSNMENVYKGLMLFIDVAVILGIAIAIWLHIQKSFVLGTSNMGSKFAMGITPYFTLFSNKNMFRLWGINVLAFVKGMQMLLDMCNEIKKNGISKGALKVLIGLLGGVLALAILMNKYGSGQGLALAALGILGIVYAFSLLLGVLTLIAKKTEDVKNFGKVLLQTGLFMAAFAVSMVVLSLALSLFRGAGRELLMLAAAIIIVVFAIKLFDDIDHPLYMIGLMILVIAALAFSIQGLSKTAPAIDGFALSLVLLAAGIASVTGAIMLVVGAIILLGMLEPYVKKGITAICSIIIYTIEQLLMSIIDLILDIADVMTFGIVPDKFWAARREELRGAFSSTMVGGYQDGMTDAQKEMESKFPARQNLFGINKEDKDAAKEEGKEVGTKQGEGFFEGISEFVSGIGDKGKNLFNSFIGFDISEGSEMFNNLTGGANDMLQLVTDTVTDGSQETFIPAVQDMGVQAGEVLGSEETLGSFDDSVTNIMETTANSFDNNPAGSKVADSVQKFAEDKILNVFNDTLGIASPSKEMIRSIHFVGRGVMVGLKKITGPVRVASKAFADDAYGSLSDSLYQMNNAISADMLDIDTNPTIAPVLDLTNVRNGVNGLNTMLDEGMLKMDATANMASVIDSSGVSGFTDTLSKSNQSLNKDTLSAMSEIKDTVSELKQAMLGMGFYINEGALVGQLIEGIDNQLGIRQGYKGRNM